MKITITVEEAIDMGIWTDICKIKGWDIFSPNEGTIDHEEEVSISKEQAEEWGLI